MQKLIFLVIVAIHYASADRVYENGCPEVNPMLDFDIEKVNISVLGICWAPMGLSTSHKTILRELAWN